jgi:hypothetical protein
MYQVEIVCNLHSRALTPSKAPRQPFGKHWAIYNIEAECEVGSQECTEHWHVLINGKEVS